MTLEDDEKRIDHDARVSEMIIKILNKHYDNPGARSRILYMTLLFSVMKSIEKSGEDPEAMMALKTGIQAGYVELMAAFNSIENAAKMHKTIQAELANRFPNRYRWPGT